MSSDSDLDTMKILALFFIVLIVSVIVHSFMRRFWVGVLIGTGIGGVVELATEILAAPTLTVRPVDVLFWGPFVITQGALFSFPIVMIVGTVFYFARKRKGRAGIPNSN